MEKLNYLDIAKALITDAQKKGIGTHFDFSNMTVLAKQLEDMFLIRWSKDNERLKNVAEYVKKL